DRKGKKPRRVCHRKLTKGEPTFSGVFSSLKAFNNCLQAVFKNQALLSIFTEKCFFVDFVKIA
ncbi:MAG TPA: hypothetical protein PLM41_17290, partial [Saprospiraceae bacterium]|nr:hypothetical protein [Saprospiraceae bacterium]